MIATLQHIFSRKLALKIWLYMMVPTLAVLIFVNISIQLYYSQFSLLKSIDRASQETAYVASSFSDAYHDLAMRFVRKTSSADFAESFLAMRDCTPSEYTDLNNSLQELVKDYADMNNLVSSVLFATVPPGGEKSLMFYSYSWRLMKGIDTYDLGLDLDQYTDSLNGLTILPSAKSPFSNQTHVIPVVAPLYVSPDQGENLVLLAEKPEDADIILYYFLSASGINDYLKLYCSDESEGALFLVNSAGTLISGPAIDNQWLENVSFREQLIQTINENQNYYTMQEHHIFVEKSTNTGLYLINVIPEKQFAASIYNLSSTLGLIAVISVLMITAISLLISLLVTTPLKKLMSSVRAIENSSYTGKAAIPPKDEIGQLNESIDSMYNTIQEQIQTIRKQEQEKYDARMQLLTEQMNPHFLYNALEFINMEVFNNHTESASSMITSLGEYLRISLACGENELMLSQELEQVMSYVSIMNHRFHHSIQVTADIPEELRYLKIVKCIFQPLVENSLKHGFQIGDHNAFPISPMIDLAVALDASYLTLSIADNGTGIDIEKATQILYSKQENSGGQHFGLNNIYERLKSAYGEVLVEFSSVPFFENKITIRLPAEFFTGQILP